MDSRYVPSYVALGNGGNELVLRANRAMEMLRACRLCPRECGARRLVEETGDCGIGSSFLTEEKSPAFPGMRGPGLSFFPAVPCTVFTARTPP